MFKNTNILVIQDNMLIDKVLNSVQIAYIKFKYILFLNNSPT